jgi:hypothetical protein
VLHGGSRGRSWRSDRLGRGVPPDRCLASYVDGMRWARFPEISS